MFFSKKKSDNQQGQQISDWHQLQSIDDLKDIIEKSYQQTVGIFKHSTRCIISKTVLKNFQKEIQRYPNVYMCYLDLLSFRELSNEVSSVLEVEHQSPQLLIVKDGKVVVHASHNQILSDIDFAKI